MLLALTIALAPAAAPSLESGDALLSQGRLEEAEKVFRALLAREKGEPERAQIHLRLGRIHARRGERTAARAAFKNAATLNHRLWEAFHAASLIELEENRPEAALEAARGCLIAKPAQPECLQAQADALARLDRAGESLAVWERLSRIRADDANVRVQLARAYREVGRDREAARALDRALALEPDNPLANYLKASMLVEEGQTERAVAHLRRALSARPEFTQAEQLLRQIQAVSQ